MTYIQAISAYNPVFDRYRISLEARTAARIGGDSEEIDTPDELNTLIALVSNNIGWTEYRITTLLRDLIISDSQQLQPSILERWGKEGSQISITNNRLDINSIFGDANGVTLSVDLREGDILQVVNYGVPNGLSGWYPYGYEVELSGTPWGDSWSSPQHPLYFEFLIEEDISIMKIKVDPEYIGCFEFYVIRQGEGEETSETIMHTVRSGDTWEIIAEEYNITVDRLRRVNQTIVNDNISRARNNINFDSDWLVVDQVLIIPEEQ
ncbi:LysM peptidoglycan-binding domain-containing protein [Candidatus Margulisiibacteriota bacterium]